MISQVTKFVQERVPSPLGEDSQICDRGSGVVKAWKHDSLAPHWNGPYTVVLTSPTAVKVAGVGPPHDGEESIPRRPGGRRVDYTTGPH